MRECDQAWAAGLFEGEGTIYVLRNRRGDKEWRYVGLSVVSTDRDVLERFQIAMAGRGAINREKRRAGGSLGTKVIWRWNVRNRPHVAEVIEALRPWLGERRTAQLEAALGAATPVMRRPHRRHRSPEAVTIHDA